MSAVTVVHLDGTGPIGITDLDDGVVALHLGDGVYLHLDSEAAAVVLTEAAVKALCRYTLDRALAEHLDAAIAARPPGSAAPPQDLPTVLGHTRWEHRPGSTDNGPGGHTA